MSAQLYTFEDNKQLNELMEQTTLARFKTMAMANKVQVQDRSSAKPFTCVPFSSKGSKNARWSIDMSALRPTPMTYLQGKNFEAAYLAQLETTLYHEGDEPPMAALIELMFLYDRIRKNGTVRAFCSDSVRRLPQMISTLNKFFRDNVDVIEAITTMVGDRVATPVESIPA